MRAFTWCTQERYTISLQTQAAPDSLWRTKKSTALDSIPSETTLCSRLQWVKILVCWYALQFWGAYQDLGSAHKVGIKILRNCTRQPFGGVRFTRLLGFILPQTKAGMEIGTGCDAIRRCELGAAMAIVTQSQQKSLWRHYQPTETLPVDELPISHYTSSHSTQVPESMPEGHLFSTIIHLLSVAMGDYAAVMHMHYTM